MTVLKKMGAVSVALIVLNEIRGVLVVLALLSGGAHALAQSDSANGGVQRAQPALPGDAGSAAGS